MRLLLHSIKQLLLYFQLLLQIILIFLNLGLFLFKKLKMHFDFFLADAEITFGFLVFEIVLLVLLEKFLRMYFVLFLQRVF